MNTLFRCIERSAVIQINSKQLKGGAMEESDLKLIEEYAKTNSELDRLFKEHLKLGKEIEALQGLKIMSPAESKQLKELKRVKLSGRDRMEEIFQELRK